MPDINTHVNAKTGGKMKKPKLCKVYEDEYICDQIRLRTAKEIFLITNPFKLNKKELTDADDYISLFINFASDNIQYSDN
jgi:hypothetical protein